LLSQLEARGYEPDQLPLLRGLAPGHRVAILGGAVQHGVAPSTVLFKQGVDGQTIGISNAAALADTRRPDPLIDETADDT
jgi:hypothetical protein